MKSTKDKTMIEPKKICDDSLYGKDGYSLYLLRPGIYQFQSRGAGSHVYLVIGENFNFLIDTGLITKFNSLNYLLSSEIGMSTEEIDFIIITHEHFDHISTNCYFSCPIAAHRWAATKISNSDELVTKAKKHSIDMKEFRVDIWLEDDVVFDLGNIRLKIIETPGHTSG
ncbi:MAG: MBL fold metallo-hydrolase, partial [Promethearchaeota archaeon]